MENTGKSGSGSGALHGGHRHRLRQRFLVGGANSMYPHELLELFLFYTRRRANVSGQAHLLADKAGLCVLRDPASAEGVCPPAMEREYRALCEKLAEFDRLYQTDKEDCLIGRRNLNSTQSATRYALSLTTGAENEQVWLLCLDNKMSLKNCVSLPCRRIDGVEFGRVYAIADRCSSSTVMLVYSHADGVCAFTREEIAAARRLFDSFKVCGIRLADIILCCDGAAAQFCTTGLLETEAVK